MTTTDRDTHIRMRAETGLAVGQAIKSAFEWARTQIQNARQKRRRRKELNRLLKLRDWQLRDIGAARGDLQAEWEKLA